MPSSGLVKRTRLVEMEVLLQGSVPQMNWTPSSISAHHAIVATMMVQRCNTYNLSMLNTCKHSTAHSEVASRASHTTCCDNCGMSCRQLFQQSVSTLLVLRDCISVQLASLSQTAWCTACMMRVCIAGLLHCLQHCLPEAGSGGAPGISSADRSAGQ